MNVPTHQNRWNSQLIAAIAAFCVYFCMYAFRKPFTAATLDGLEFNGQALKSVMVVAQLSGYMLSKFIGIKVISEMPRHRRAFAIVSLIAFAELALVGYAFAPMPAKILFIFLNGLPLGMIFGLVLAYLEGRKFTEAMTAILCASFISSSGFVKSVGKSLIDDYGISEFHMPYLTGLIFLLPLLLSVLVLDRTPDPDPEDIALRRERPVMSGKQRWDFFRAYMPGLILLVIVYVALTVVRTFRDDYAVEIWQELGSEEPTIYARSETMVAVVVFALNGAAFFIRRNLTALMSVLLLMTAGFALVGLVLRLQAEEQMSAFAFMVICGIGMYIPYVAFHTTVFERLIASSNRVANLGFLMYLADALGYLGYALLVNTVLSKSGQELVVFRTAAWATVLLSIVSLVSSMVYFWFVLRGSDAAPAEQS